MSGAARGGRASNPAEGGRTASSLRGAPPIDDAALAAASAEDLRCLGLLAFLCHDVVAAIDVWSRLNLIANPDPLIEASLGELFLCTEQPSRAYPRLLSACRAYRDVGFLWVNLADAAVQIGGREYAAEARRILDDARGMPRLDAMLSLERVEADYYAEMGYQAWLEADAIRAGLASARSDRREDTPARIEARAAAESGALTAEARAREWEARAKTFDARAVGMGELGRPLGVESGEPKGYEFFHNCRENPPARDHYAQFLIRRGRMREAAVVYSEIVHLRPTVRRYREKFVSTLDAWWASLDAGRRYATIRASLDESPFTPESLVQLLRLYVECVGVVSTPTVPHQGARNPQRSDKPLRPTTPRLRTAARDAESERNGTALTATSLSLLDWANEAGIPEFAASARRFFASSLERLTLPQLRDRLEVPVGVAGDRVAAAYAAVRELIAMVTASASEKWLIAAASVLAIGALTREVTAQTCGWTQRHPLISPSPRYGPGLAFDDQRSVLVLFGGWVVGSASSETWEWDGAAGTWTPRGAVGPSARYMHKMAYDELRHEVVLFGGWGPTGYLGDTWAWNGSSWTQRSTTNAPAARRPGGMAYDSDRGVIVLFGGYYSDGATTTFLNDTWEWNGSAWTRVHLGDPLGVVAPLARESVGLAYDRSTRKTMLFGGQTTPGGVYANDLWSWDGDTRTWTRLAASSLPATRLGHTFVYDESLGGFGLFGGYGSASFLNDTWLQKNGNWASMSPNGPAARYLQAAAYDRARGVTVVFGGDAGSYFGDTWELRICCPGDLNADRAVDSSDLGILLSAWQAGPAGDLDGDSDTDSADLGILLANWGQTCP
ncbi:MAG: kelch repeat-containing protein [Phycisphaerae bacterium]